MAIKVRDEYKAKSTCDLVDLLPDASHRAEILEELKSRVRAKHGSSASFAFGLAAEILNFSVELAPPEVTSLPPEPTTPLRHEMTKMLNSGWDFSPSWRLTEPEEWDPERLKGFCKDERVLNASKLTDRQTGMLNMIRDHFESWKRKKEKDNRRMYQSANLSS